MRYLVSSQSVAGAYYDVAFGRDGWWCSCPYNLYGNRRCRHIRAVAGLVMKERRMRDGRPGGMRIGRPEVKCRFCGSADCRKVEIRGNRDGEAWRYRCGGCSRRFTHNPGFVGRHFSPDVITDALQGCAAGLSPAKVAEGMIKKGIRVNESTVYRWARDYGGLIDGFYRGLHVPVGYTWHVDEIHFKSQGTSMWLFGVMDAETRQIIAYDTATDKISYDATSLFADAVAAAGKRPDILITDGLNGFKTGYGHVMYTNTTPRTCHIADVGIRDRHAANNLYERLNGEIKDRIARVRGFKSKTPALLRLLIVYHNLVRPHSNLDGRTPAETAGITIDGSDKWLTLIQQAASSCA